MSAPRRRPQRGPDLDLPLAASQAPEAPAAAARPPARARAAWSRSRRSPAVAACMPSARRATSRPCARCGSARTRSSMPPTARCSARSLPSATGRSSRSRASAPGCRRRPSRSRTGASTRTAASTRRASPAPSRRRPGAQGRPGRLDDHAAARPQPLHLERAHGAAEAEGGVPRDQAQRRLVEAAHPRDVPQPGLLRQPRLRDRGGLADVLLEAGPRAQPPRVGAARRADAGAVGLRPVRRDGEGARPPQRRPARDARPGLDHAEQYAWATRSATCT